MAEVQLVTPVPDGEDITLVMRGQRADIEPNVLDHIRSQRQAGRPVVPLQIEGTTDEETAAMMRAVADALDPPAPPQPEEGDDAPSEEDSE